MMLCTVECCHILELIDQFIKYTGNYDFRAAFIRKNETEIMFNLIDLYRF